MIASDGGSAPPGGGPSRGRRAQLGLDLATGRPRDEYPAHGIKQKEVWFAGGAPARRGLMSQVSTLITAVAGFAGSEARALLGHGLKLGARSSGGVHG